MLIGGFILALGSGSSTAVVRALGPSLQLSGVGDELSDPTVELRDANGTLTGFNDNWKDDPLQAVQIAATGLAPTHDAESAIVATLPPGASTAVVRGRNGATGVALVEVYNLQ